MSDETCPKCGSPIENRKHQLVFRSGRAAHLLGLARTDQCRVNELQQALAAAQARESRLRKMMTEFAYWTDAEIDAALTEEPKL